MLPESFWGRIIYLLQQYGPSFAKGAGVSMWLALVGTLFGCIIAAMWMKTGSAHTQRRKRSSVNCGKNLQMRSRLRRERIHDVRWDIYRYGAERIWWNLNNDPI